MRTTVTLDQDIHEAALALARASGRTLGQILSELARRGLALRTTPRRRGKTRFPVFEVPPNAPIISAAVVQAFLDRDDVS